MANPDNVGAPSIGPSVNKQILSSSADVFRQSHPFDKVVVGAATFQYTSSSDTIPIVIASSSSTSAKTPRILLLKGAPHEPFYPNVFEVPGGHVDPDDPSIYDALVREVKEETGLGVDTVLAELDPMTYTTEKTSVHGSGEDARVTKSIQLNCVVSVLDGAVRLNPDEHSESRWAPEAELADLDITSAMRAVIQDAFHWTAHR